jgi:replicative DNA helicase
MKGLFDTGKPIDTVTVSELIFKDSKNSKSINASYIARLVDNVPSSANFERYIEIVLEHSHRRKLLKASGRIELLAMAMDKEIHSVLDEAEQTIFPTYFADLDYYLSGLQEGNLIVLASRPSMGKSSLGLNIGTNVSKEGKVVAFFSLEMTKEELVQRVLFSEAKVTSGDARKGQLGPEKWSRVVEAASKVNSLPLYFDDAPVITVTDIRAKSRRLKSSKGLDLIVVDYLQLMQSSSGDNRQQEIAEISRNLKNLARELRVPILALSQLNRAAEAREDKRPRLGDLRESGAIEQDADIVMMLYRDDYYNPGTEIPGVAEVNIVKNRSGQTGKVELFFSKEFTQFSNYSKQEQQ